MACGPWPCTGQQFLATAAANSGIACHPISHHFACNPPNVHPTDTALQPAQAFLLLLCTCSSSMSCSSCAAAALAACNEVRLCGCFRARHQQHCTQFFGRQTHPHLLGGRVNASGVVCAACMHIQSQQQHSE
jgi:hypothetical protein